MTYPDDHPGSWYTWLVQDQRFVDNRPDVLTWQTDELQDDVTISGQVTAKLFASTTGTDSDWVVKLIDVYPQKVEKDWKLSGFELMVADEIFRGRYWKSFEKPEPLVAERGDALLHRPAHRRSCLQKGSPHHGAGAEHLVPALRPQSAKIRAEHF